MAPRDNSFTHLFERLLAASEAGRRAEVEELSQKLLTMAPEALVPLAEYTAGQPRQPRLGVLLELLGKMGDPAAAGVLLPFLESDFAELRLRAAIALGWLRAAAALEKLDELEVSDPESEVRREAQIALEEILRDWPSMRRILKFHKPIPLGEKDELFASEAARAEPEPVDPETRKRLAACFPRLISLRYKVVPLSFGCDDVVVCAIPNLVDEQPPPADLERLAGRRVELHPWPIDRIYERILSFYEWGDDDWVRFGELVSPEARKEAVRLALEGIQPAMPPPALPDCVDGLEAAQAFLSTCARPRVTSALVERNGTNALRICVSKNGQPEPLVLDPPPVQLWHRFLATLVELTGYTATSEATRSVGQGALRLNLPGHDGPLVAFVSGERMGSREVLAFEFLHPGRN